ncbi:hypothetical protein VNO78_03234 [Psophocarpus tetragonolobus]|uniref:F-box domain-containing protein n=1 Tax=Psophocarpus tetragonolobus TaxID=3891 RepID=A0AAN9XWR9_PSOTE
MKNKPNLFLTLPKEVIEKILLRLSVRSLLRLKCVCKSWLSIISDPHFAKSHSDVTVASPQRVLVKFPDHCRTLDIEAPLNHDSEVRIPVPSPSLSPQHPHPHHVDVVGSCRGFILLGAVYSDMVYFFVWNPTTHVYRLINKPFLYYGPKRPLCGIGYDSSKDDYVVVVIPSTSSPRPNTEVFYFSLSNNSWNFIRSDVPYKFKGGELRFGSFLRGAIHWLVGCYDPNDFFKIVAFDVRQMTLSEILLPRELANNSCLSHFYKLMVLEGYLCLRFSRTAAIKWFKMWIMKEYKVHSSWSNSSIISDYCDHYISFDPNCKSIDPICATKDGEVLAYVNCQRLMKLNGIAETPDEKCRPDETCSFDNYTTLSYFLYKESLLPPPQDFEKPSEE